MGHKRPNITQNHINQIQQLIIEHPEWHRTRLSKELCELWDWKSPVGTLKDISARDLLRDLNKKGQINLPAARFTPRAAGGIGADKIKSLDYDIKPIESKLSEQTPLHIEIVSSKKGMDLFKSYIHHFHYLGYDRSVGENIKYFVYSKNGAILACIMFGSSAWSCHDRDEYIGWNTAQRRAGLHLISNNHRFLIPEGIRIPHLASHVLGLVSRRISNDWQIKYGHGLVCLETFVECDLFRGVCYRAANWRHIGTTTGLGRNSATGEKVLPLKDIWLYPLCKNFRERLCNPEPI